MITLFHDFTSPASAVAVARAHRLQDRGAAIELVGLEAIGVDMHVPVTLDVLAQLDELAAAAAREQITMRRPQLLPPTGPAHVVERALPSSAARAWREACYAAFWAKGRDLSDTEVLRAVGKVAGVAPAILGPLLDDPLALAALRRETAEHRRNGVGGVPVILAHRTLVPGLLDDDELLELASS